MYLRNMVASALLLLAATATQAAVMDFDDISPTLYTATFNNYKGFIFENAYVIHKNFHAGSGYDKNTVSGHYTAWTPYQSLTMSLAAPGVFSFQGVNLAAAWETTKTLNIKGYKDSTELYSINHIITNSATTRFNFNWTGINKLVFTKLGGNQFALDNLTYNVATNSVSAPASIGLFACALSLLGLRRRKQAV